VPDSSADAYRAFRANAELNGCADDGWVYTIHFELSARVVLVSEEYDVVVDPQKQRSVATLDKAQRKYHSFNRDALKLISGDGGLIPGLHLFSGHDTKDGGQYFPAMVHQAARAAGAPGHIVEKAGAASCHTQSPISWPAGDYLRRRSSTCTPLLSEGVHGSIAEANQSMGGITGIYAYSTLISILLCIVDYQPAVSRVLKCHVLETSSELSMHTDRGIVVSSYKRPSNSSRQFMSTPEFNVSSCA
jgi:hypothetical protein